MKNLALNLIFLSFALAPIAHADVLQQAEGLYTAKGKLVSQSMLPDVSFQSTRELENGVIHATTKAYLLGWNVATVSANLKVKQREGGQFDLLDLDAGAKLAGQGFCDSVGCTFTATVMDGRLRLTETWVRTTRGFDAVHCSQTFDGNDSTYEASFEKIR